MNKDIPKGKEREKEQKQKQERRRRTRPSESASKTLSRLTHISSGCNNTGLGICPCSAK